jgi:CubicO group peptidase (beta-lactamase class C family)
VKINRKVGLLSLLGTAIAVASAPTSFAIAQQTTDPNVNKALQELDSYVHDAMSKTGVPGASVAVVYKDRVVFLSGYGVRKLGTLTAVDPDTVFEIASFSKPIGTTVVAALVGRGEVSFDDRIKDLDPEFQLSNPSITQQVTVRDFLSHRSTLPGDAGDTLESLGFTRPDILHRLRYVPLKGTFRQTYQYSNLGITEGALAAVKSQGKPWEDVSAEVLYDKLGMTSTSSRFSDYANRPNRASLHYLETDGKFRDRYVREADAEAPAGGVSSSARDLAAWLRMQLAGGSYNGQQIVDQAALAETHKREVCQAVAPDGSCPGGQYYGMGWDVSTRPTGETLLSHSGAFLLGAATTVYMIPSKQIGILVLTNGTPVGLPEAIALTFLDNFEYGAPKKDYLTLAGQTFANLRASVLASSTNYSAMKAPANPAPAGPTSQYVGIYNNRYFGQVEVEQQDQKLILRLPPLGAYYELSHWDGNTYTYYIANESSAAARRGVKFSSDGKEITVENLDFEYSNVFTRSHP